MDKENESDLKKKAKTNQRQYERLVEFMNSKPDIARNFTSRPPEETNNFWETVVETLNSLGPPIRDTIGWKKVWSDYKTYIKKKLMANNKECTATGGGPYKQKTFNELEESVIALINIKSSFTGVGAKSFGEKQGPSQPEDAIQNLTDAILAEPEEAEQAGEVRTSPASQRPPRRRKALTSIQLLSKQIKMQESTSKSIKDMAWRMKKINQNLTDIKDIEKKTERDSKPQQKNARDRKTKAGTQSKNVGA